MLKSIASLGLAGAIVAGTWIGAATVQPAAPAADATTPPPTLRRRPAVTPVIRVDGDVAGVAAGASGTLTLRLDGQLVHQAPASASGFVVEVPSSASGMLTLEYTQPGVHFVSPLGSYARLVRMAGADGRLTRDECECTRLTPFSTALQQVGGMMLGHAPRSDVELRNAARQAGYDLTNATVVLARLAADPTLLPPGHATGLDLLRDRPAFVAYLYDTLYSVLDDPTAALDPLPTATMDASRLPDRFALLGPVLDVATPTPAAAYVLERDGGTFRMHAASGSLGVPHVGTADGDALVLVPDGEITLFNPTYRCPFTGQMTGRRWTMVRHVLQRQWASDGLDIWRLVSEADVSFPDCPGMDGYLERGATFLPFADLAGTRPLTTERRFLGDRALPVFCSTAGQHNGIPLDTCGYAVHRFSRGGTGEMLDLGDKVDAYLQPIQAQGRAPFSWSMGSDGAMHVQAGDERTRYWVLDGGDGAALGVVHVTDAERETGHASLAGYTAMIRVGAADSYTAATATGAWGFATYDAITTPHIDQEASDVRILRDASGRSRYWESGHVASQERWTTAWGRLYSTRYPSSSCVAPSETCTPQAVRYFRPLARVGNRIHGIEEMINSGGTDGSGNPLPPSSYARPQYHERREMPADLPAGRSEPARTSLRGPLAR